MLNHFTACVLLATLFSFVIPLNGIELPISFPKCNLNKNVSACIAETFTNMVQNSKDFPGLGIPKMDPYKSKRPFTVSNFRITPLLSGSAHWTNIMVDGLNKSTVQLVSGYQPGAAVSNMLIKVYIPELDINMNTNSELRAGLLHVKPHGRVTVHLGGVQVTMIGKAHTVHRDDGNDYIVIGDGTVTNQIASFKGYAHYYNRVSRFMYGMADNAINNFWRLLKPFIDPIVNRFIHEQLQEIIEPMFNAIPIQKFIDMDPSAPAK